VEPAAPGSGSLTVVGTGIQLATHLTPEARAAITGADVVLTLVSEPVMLAAVESLNPATRPLQNHYVIGESRAVAYEAMVQDILDHVRRGLNVCAAFYGHPGVFVAPSHEAVRRAREEGFKARMLPGVSAEDCLFADLGVDPARFGCLSYEATDFLVHGRVVDTTAALVLWQLGTVGNAAAAEEAAPVGLEVLVDVLLAHYPPDHEVAVYEASPYPGFDARIVRVPLAELRPEHATAMSTLFVPPAKPPELDLTMLDRLGLPRP
jgi:uncharacterized protein YabN with tetrapyrrole methylase and pyrophosphatase domain